MRQTFAASLVAAVALVGVNATAADGRKDSLSSTTESMRR